MQITDKRTMFNFSHTTEAGVEATGNVEFTGELLTNMNASFNKDGNFMGSAYYSETTDGKINKSLNNIDKEFDACSVLEEVVSKAKESYNENGNE